MTDPSNYRPLLLRQNVRVPWRIIATDRQIVPPDEVDVRPVDVFAALTDEQIAQLAHELIYELNAGGYRPLTDITEDIVREALDAVLRKRDANRG